MKKYKILCVDDDSNNLELLFEILHEYDVVVSLNAASALHILKEQSIDMILLDIVMPDIDGYTLCTTIKEHKEYQDIPILFLSAKSDELSIEHGYDLGGVDYISKPIKPQELLARVKTHLKLSSLVNDLEHKVQEALEQKRHQEHLLVKQSYAASMGEMIDVIAHQWKQPLNVLNMRLSTIMLDYEDELIDKAYLQELQDKSLFQIRHLVNTLNDFRSFMSPHKPIQSFSVQEMLSSSLRLIEEEFTLHKIEIEIDRSHDFTINAIENEFIHIILNILNNAKDALIADAIKEPKITIQIDANKKQIQISDNAKGIQESDINSIFDLHFTRKKSSSGSGVGLYMSKMIIEKYGGTISIKNGVNGGALVAINVEN